MVALLTLAFFLTQGALAFPALLDLDSTVPSQWIVAIFISIVYCLVFYTLHRHIDRLERNNTSLQVENETLADQCRNIEKLEMEHEALQAAHDRLQADNENLQAISAQHQRQCEELQTVNIAITAERDQFRAQCQALQAATVQRQTQYAELQTRITDITAERDRLQAQCRELRTTSNQHQTEFQELQTRHTAVTAQRDQLQQRYEDLQTITNQYQRRYEALRGANVTLTAERDRLRASENRYREAMRNDQRSIANLTANFPNNARFISAPPHQIGPHIVLTKDGRPDRRYREGKTFSIFSSDTSFVIHNGKRVCMMLTTVAEI